MVAAALTLAPSLGQGQSDPQQLPAPTLLALCSFCPQRCLLPRLTIIHRLSPAWAGCSAWPKLRPLPGQLAVLPLLLHVLSYREGIECKQHLTVRGEGERGRDCGELWGGGRDWEVGKEVAEIVGSWGEGMQVDGEAEGMGAS